MRHLNNTTDDHHVTSSVFFCSVYTILLKKRCTKLQNYIYILWIPILIIITIIKFTSYNWELSITTLRPPIQPASPKKIRETFLLNKNEKLKKYLPFSLACYSQCPLFPAKKDNVSY